MLQFVSSVCTWYVAQQRQKRSIQFCFAEHTTVQVREMQRRPLRVIEHFRFMFPKRCRCTLCCTLSTYRLPMMALVPRVFVVLDCRHLCIFHEWRRCIKIKCPYSITFEWSLAYGRLTFRQLACNCVRATNGSCEAGTHLSEVIFIDKCNTMTTGTTHLQESALRSPKGCIIWHVLMALHALICNTMRGHA